MDNSRGELRLLFFAIAATLLTAFTLALLWVGASFMTSPPVKAQLAAWTDGLFPGFQPPEHLVSARYAVDPAPFIPITGGELRVQADALPVAESSTPTPTVTAFSQPTDTPVEEPLAPQGRLVIPSLGVDQTLQRVPVANGDWDVSGLIEQVGWLETTGAEPLDRFAMVFVGHVTLPRPDGPGPFHRLRELKAGDEVRYRLGEKEYVYRVDEREIVPPNAVDRLYVRDGQKIVLVTCSDWNYLAQQYDYRLVVQASMVRTEQSSGAVE